MFALIGRIDAEPKTNANQEPGLNLIQIFPPGACGKNETQHTPDAPGFIVFDSVTKVPLVDGVLCHKQAGLHRPDARSCAASRKPNGPGRYDIIFSKTSQML